MRGQNYKITGGFYAKHRRIDTQESFVKSPVVVAVDEKVSGYRQVGNATGGGRGLITSLLRAAAAKGWSQTNHNR